MKEGSTFIKFLEQLGKIKAVRVNREEYLRKEFQQKYSAEKIMKIIAQGPIKSGISAETIREHATAMIKHEALEATVLSTASGLPGGLAIGLTIPADLLQYYIHVLIVIQKMMYLYGWEEDIFNSYGELDDATKNALIMYLGIAAGGAAAKQVTTILGKNAVKNMAKNVAKGMFKNPNFWKLSAKIVKLLGIRTTTKMIVKGIKFVPIIGGAVSGAITAATFVPTAMRLLKYFDKGIIEDEEDT